MKIAAVAAVIAALIVGALIYRRAVRADENAEARAQLEREARQHVDLSTLPPVETPDEDKKPAVKFKKKPIVVEMVLKQKKGKGSKPFRGTYRLLNAAGDVVGQEEALGDGQPAVFIVTPGYYRLQVPGTKFQQDLTLVGDESGKMHLDVLVAAK